MAPSSLGKQTAYCEPPHNWLMSLGMDLAACMTCGGENDTNGSHLAVFSEDIAFAHHLVAFHPPPSSHPIGVLVVLAMPVKNYLKWLEIQLVTQCTVDTVNYFE